MAEKKTCKGKAAPVKKAAPKKAAPKKAPVPKPKPAAPEKKPAPKVPNKKDVRSLASKYRAANKESDAAIKKEQRALAELWHALEARGELPVFKKGKDGFKTCNLFEHLKNKGY